MAPDKLYFPSRVIRLALSNDDRLSQAADSRSRSNPLPAPKTKLSVIVASRAVNLRTSRRSFGYRAADRIFRSSDRGVLPESIGFFGTAARKPSNPFPEPSKNHRSERFDGTVRGGGEEAVWPRSEERFPKTLRNNGEIFSRPGYRFRPDAPYPRFPSGDLLVRPHPNP